MSKEVSENKKLLPKRISFRPLKELDEALETLMETHKINKTEAIEHIFREWQILTRQDRENPTVETDLKKDLDEPYPPCDFRIFDTRTNRHECLNTKPRVNLKHFSETGLIPPVCLKCQELKEPRYIFCDNVHRDGKIISDWIPFKQKTEKKCRECKLKYFDQWKNCQEDKDVLY